MLQIRLLHAEQLDSAAGETADADVAGVYVKAETGVPRCAAPVAMRVDGALAVAVKYDIVTASRQAVRHVAAEAITPVPVVAVTTEMAGLDLKNMGRVRDARRLLGL